MPKKRVKLGGNGYFSTQQQKSSETLKFQCYNQLLPEGDNEADEAVEAGKSVMEDEEEKEKKP